MNGQNSIGAMLREALEKKIAKRNAQYDARDRMIRAGFSREEINQFIVLYESMNDMAGALACTQSLVELRRHVPSAQATVTLAEYLLNSVGWMYSVLQRANVDPSIFDMRNDYASFTRLMERARDEAQALLSEVAETVAD